MTTSQPIADPDTPDTAELAEFVALLTDATPAQLFKAETLATVYIGAGVDVEQCAQFLDAIRSERAHRAGDG